MNRGPGAALRLWARSELVRRWRALVALGVIAGLAAGLALAAVAGARRTSTAYDRFREETAAPDAILFATLVGVFDQDYSPVAALPEVVAAGTFVLAPIGVGEPSMGTLAPGDDQLYRTLSRPLLVKGRMPDPRRTDEILVNRAAASKYHLRPGRRVTVSSSTDIEQQFTGAPTGGPHVRATIVGVGDSTIDHIFFGDEPGFTPSAGFLERFPEMPAAPNLLVRLRPGTDVEAFGKRAAAALDLPDIPIRDLADDRKRITHSTDLERTGLLLFAGAVALAGIILVGQALARTVYGMADSGLTLRAIGFTGPDLAVGLMLPLLVSALTAVAVAEGAAIVLSGWFPVGQARRLDPDVGIHLDWRVLAPGAALLVILVLAGAALAAFRAIRPSAGRAGRPSSITVRAIRRRAPLPVAIGASLALEARPRDRSLPVRPALAGAAVAVLGVVGALGLVRGIDDALARPARSGQVWDAAVTPAVSEEGPVPVPESLISSLLTHPRAAEVASLHISPLELGGTGSLVFTLEPVRGDIAFAVLRGRAPRSPDEVALGPASARALGKTVGDEVQVGGRGRRLRIVGLSLLPQTPHTSFDQGAWATPGVLERLSDPESPATDEETLLVRARPGTSSTALVAQLRRDLTDVEVEAPDIPQDVLALRNVRSLPQALAVFLVLLGLAALAHALVTAVRRRRHDLAVLRAMGFRPWQSAACIAWQAMTVAVVGLLVGIPLGIAFGRGSWQWVADATPLLYVPPVAAVAAVAAIPTAIVMANTLAALPARRAARLRPADDLRSE